MPETAVSHFRISGTPVIISEFGSGHINSTYRVQTDDRHVYILQRINKYVFSDPKGVMENVGAVTEYLRGRVSDPSETLNFMLSDEGTYYYVDEDDEYWRCYEFADGICLEAPESDKDFYESAIAFGRFQELLGDFPAQTLHETIPMFHNTVNRYRQFREALNADRVHRAITVRDEIAFIEAREQEAGTLVHLLETGELPLRVTHNDTKLNNVLLNAKTRKAMCVLDLDTVMPGSSLYDFGDSIRFGAATAAEDEPDLDKMELNLDLFRVYTRGYLTACPSLTEKETELLPLGAKIITLELAVRFLTDYLDGDRYFKIAYPDHNLVRARTQLKLVADMEKKWDEMQRIVREEAANAKKPTLNYLGIDYQVKNMPVLDEDFIPFGVWIDAYEKGASQPLAIAIERDKSKISVHHTKIHGTPELAEADYRFVERYVKFLLWSIGGFRIYICGNSALAQRLQKAYTLEGERKFDVQFMQDVYEVPFEVIDCKLEDCPKANEAAVHIGGHMDGCRIGFDAGGSDRKVSAVIDGKTVYSEEVVWHPKTESDPQYHFDGIVAAFKTAASKMPRVDGIGVSSAGVFIGNSPMVSSLFIKVPREKRELVKTIYDRAAKELGDVPIVVANDGDVTALAGAMGMEVGSVMGMAMGTSEAVGYVDADGNVLGWLNELAFAPVDLYEGAMADEWSTDIGVGCKYFSQDAVIKLAPKAGIELDESLTPAEKLKAVQALVEKGDERARKIFASIGAYLAHTMKLYCRFYDVHHMIVLGRVMSGIGGSIVLDSCLAIMQDEYPELAEKVRVMLPDEKTRRVGQSVAAASLPEARK